MRCLWGIVLAFWGAVAAAQSVSHAQDEWTARFEGPTARYGHAIMGDLPEWSRLCLEGPSGSACTDLTEASVFEDLAPRLGDMDGDGQLDAVVVESSVTGGAALVVYQLVPGGLKRTSTPAIGRRNRWLAPVGIGDFDGDGRMDVAYVETPHLGKRLKIVTWDQGVLKLSATVSGLSNHRIGDEFITSGIRDCGYGIELIVPNGRWSRVFAGRFAGGAYEFEDIGPFRGVDDFAGYLSC